RRSGILPPKSCATQEVRAANPPVRGQFSSEFRRQSRDSGLQQRPDLSLPAPAGRPFQDLPPQDLVEERERRLRLERLRVKGDRPGVPAGEGAGEDRLEIP